MLCLRTYFILFAFYISCISVVWFLKSTFLYFSISFSIESGIIFCWSSKKPWDRSGGILVFKVVFLFSPFHKNNRSRNLFQFYLLKSNYNRVLDASGLAESNFNNTPYFVREWCRFFTKLVSLLSKSDCFQPVSFGIPGTPNSVAEGCQLSSLFVCWSIAVLYKTRKRLQRGFNLASLCCNCVC